MWRRASKQGLDGCFSAGLLSWFDDRCENTRDKRGPCLRTVVAPQNPQPWYKKKKKKAPQNVLKNQNDITCSLLHLRPSFSAESTNGSLRERATAGPHSPGAGRLSDHELPEGRPRACEGAQYPIRVPPDQIGFSGSYRIFLKDNIQRAALSNLDRVGERPDGRKMEVWGEKKTEICDACKCCLD